MIPMLIYILVLVLIAGLLIWLVQTLPIAEPFRSVAMVLIVIVVILILVSMLVPYPWPRTLR